MYIKHYKQKSVVRKTVTLTSLQKPQLLPLSILLNFVHPLLRLYLLCYFAVILCFIHFRGRSHSLKFDKFRDTASPFNLKNIKVTFSFRYPEDSQLGDVI